ncbi:MAG: helix-turn-helix transcriptional regulator [Lachnospiraceae bacterium]|nr:helix-turn-helix transcriptional regulator [Lachnospiraceae bacterium]
MQFIEEMTDGRLTLGAGTLYGALTTLEKKGWIEPSGEDDNRRKVYRITGEGKAIAVRERERLEKITRVASDIIGGAGL